MERRGGGNDDPEQRVISTTAVKCVGNTVVLHGIPYAPPYEISALGDQARLRDALARSEPIQIYQQYVEAYGLVFQVESNPSAPFRRTRARSTLSCSAVHRSAYAATAVSANPSRKHRDARAITIGGE